MYSSSGKPQPMKRKRPLDDNIKGSTKQRNKSKRKQRRQQGNNNN